MKIVINSALSVFILLFSFTGFTQKQDTTKLPNKNIKVQREYDEDGNLIRYDSTYVYSWSSDSSYHFNPDSSFFNFSNSHEMRKKMKEHLEHLFKRDSSAYKSFHHPFFSDDFFNRDFFEPQFFQNDFFSRDSSRDNFFEEFEEMFEDRMNFENENRNQMHHKLDSIRQNFMKQRKKYFKQRDSIYQQNRKKKSGTIDI
ncbi:MAG: hypothetical protein JEZ01_07205 [Labilibaculum sp.]|jgi:hypothetical protein|nr:hypothetical protein [Labilibaculum sp.]MBI9057545.1 hypothetical protein [Labilibaculum sp.]